jgi:imidazolonepropionase
MAQPVDLVVHSSAHLLTLGGAPGPRRGTALRDLGVLEDGALAAHEGRILAVGSTEEIRDRWRGRVEIDASGRTVLPAFVDPHTHPCFAGNRYDEFEARCLGESYAEIASRGGGILRTVEATRRAPTEDLARAVRRRLDRFLSLGTTLVEAKSGYGLSTEHERRSLEAIALAARDHAVAVHPTFLGAHAIPPEHRGDRAGTVRRLVEETLPRIAGLARSCDVFLEPGVAFDREEAGEILRRARSVGLLPRVHADQLSSSGGAELAVEVGAASADHLEHVSDRGIDALAASETVAVLLPAVSFYLREVRDAPARRLVDAGAIVALGTDFNPGSCPCPSMKEILTFACVRLGLRVSEAIVAATVNAAHALGAGDERGRLVAGSRADFLVCDVPDARALGAEFGWNPVQTVVAGGRLAQGA